MPNQYRISLLNSSILLLIVLTVVGYAGNYFSYPFGFGVDFLFGSIAILIIVSLYGMWWGAFCSVIASSYTIILWQHPYALIIFVGEALFVGWRMRRGDRQLLISDMIFWVSIGMPLVLLFYGYILQVGTITTLIILLKQPVNGIFNALVASLILNYQPIHRWSNPSAEKATVLFKQLLLDLLVAFVLIPALILMVINNQIAMKHEQNILIANLEASAENLANDLQRWHQFGLSALRDLARSSSQSQIVVSGQSQYVLKLITESFPLFSEAYIINADLQVIATSQAESTSKQVDFSRINLPREPQIFVIPNSLEQDSPDEMPEILQTLPIILDGRWLGNIIAELNIEFIEKLLETETHSVPMVSTLLDQKKLSIATTNRQSGIKNLLTRQNGEIRSVASPDLQSEIFHWLPTSEGKPLIARWRESFYIQNSLIDEEIPLILSMEAPAAPYIDYLQLLYIRNLAILLAIALVSIAIARYLSRLLIEPIVNLAIFTTDLPDKILGNQIVKLPRSSIIETNALANNFEVMSRTVEDNIQQIRLTNQKLKQAKDKSEVANKAKDQFLANISYELKTPLNSIIGYSRLIHENLTLRSSYDDLDHHKFLEWLEHIQQNSKYLLTLIDEILDLAKSKANKMRLHPSVVEVASFTEDIVVAGRQKAAQKNLSFKFEASDNLPVDIYTDEQRLRQVLLNLIDNAVKFTDRGEITLQISRINADPSGLKNRIRSSAVAESSLTNSLPSQVCWRFQVIDTGIGIARRDVTRIFQPFEQVDRYEFSEVGTGLGLSISSQLVELMGGKLKVKTQLDRGSMFWFDLAFPEIKVTSVVESRSVKEIVGYKGKQLTILIVDDSKTGRLLFQDILEPKGFKILTATNGQQALQLARQNKPDLILTDIFMPIKTGLTLIAELRRDSDYAQTPIIAVSASSFEEIDRQSRAAGCNSFITKPVDDRRLLKLLGKHLNIKWIYKDSRYN